MTPQYPPTILVIERKLASAHRAVWSAANQAEAFSNQALADDLHQIAMELQRCLTDLLKRQHRLKTRPTVRA